MQIEGIILSLVFIELIRPDALEVNGIDEKHHDVGIDLVNDLLNFAVGIFLNPAIDDINRSWIVKLHMALR